MDGSGDADGVETPGQHAAEQLAEETPMPPVNAEHEGEESSEGETSSSSSSSSDSSDGEEEESVQQVPDPLSYLDLRKAFQTRKDRKEAEDRALLKQNPSPALPPVFSGPGELKPSPEEYELILNLCGEFSFLTTGRSRVGWAGWSGKKERERFGLSPKNFPASCPPVPEIIAFGGKIFI